MFNKFLIKKMLKGQLKGMPEEEQERMIKIISENPNLFKTIANEVQEKAKGGKDQMSAVMEVMKSHQDELKGLL